MLADLVLCVVAAAAAITAADDEALRHKEKAKVYTNPSLLILKAWNLTLFSPSDTIATCLEAPLQFHI